MQPSTPGTDGPAQWTVVVPVKATVRGKTRISATPAQRRALARAMALDTVTAILGSPSVRRVLAVVETADDGELLGSMTGVEVFVTTTTELNPAILEALAMLPAGAGPVAVVPADLPGLLSTDLTRTLDLCAGLAFAVVADRSGAGTTILAGRRPTDINPVYGLGSFARHVASGAVPVSVPVSSSVRADVDTLAEALATKGPRTAAAVIESGLAGERG